MVQLVDPLTDARWGDLAGKHPDASVFHSVAWLRALRDSYGYQPLVLTTSPQREPLRNGLVFCRVDSWLTGRRWVSLPFSDHAEPLLEDPSELTTLLEVAESHRKAEHLRYIELRPVRAVLAEPGYEQSSFVFHQVDLSPNLESLFAGLHLDSIQRKIRRATREKLVYTEGSSAAFIDDFYRLLLLTRKRHGIPPQPKSWFQNLAQHFGENMKTRIASHAGRPVAAIITLRHGATMVYKYGCSDESLHKLGGMQMLMWRAIEDAKLAGLTSLDLGRSDKGNEGLVVYKDRWGAARSNLTYWRRTGQKAEVRQDEPSEAWAMRLAGQVFSHLPGSLSTMTGQLLYRHLA